MDNTIFLYLLNLEHDTVRNFPSIPVWHYPPPHRQPVTSGLPLTEANKCNMLCLLTDNEIILPRFLLILLQIHFFNYLHFWSILNLSWYKMWGMDLTISDARNGHNAIYQKKSIFSGEIFNCSSSLWKYIIDRTQVAAGCILPVLQ